MITEKWIRDGVEIGVGLAWRPDGRYCECGHARPGHRGYYRPAPGDTTACVEREPCPCTSFVAETGSALRVEERR